MTGLFLKKRLTNHYSQIIHKNICWTPTMCDILFDCGGLKWCIKTPDFSLEELAIQLGKQNMDLWKGNILKAWTCAK